VVQVAAVPHTLVHKQVVLVLQIKVIKVAMVSAVEAEAAAVLVLLATIQITQPIQV
jgi:hypothetical protein